ncbi:MAG: leucine-rich repeat protein [Candidatus Cloacimonetes bacterium]|nr:leucine-rich repeat protein [Candidatus Cloacimonadota bacterium]
MKNLKPILLIILLINLSILSLSGQSNHVILDINTNTRSLQAQPSNDPVIIEMFSEVDRYRSFDWNQSLRNINQNNIGSNIALSFFDDALYTAEIQRASINDGGRTVITAKINESLFGYTIITVSDNAITMLAKIHENDEFFFASVKHGEAFIGQMRLSKMQEDVLPCAVCEEDHDIDTHHRNDNNFPIYDPNEEVTIDLLYVYTPAAELWALNSSTVTDIHHLIDITLATSNLIMENSNTGVTFSIVYRHLTDYIETDSNTDLVRIRTPNDGYMDEVHDLRDNYYADMIVFLADITYVGGEASVLNSFYGFYPDWLATSINAVQMASSTYVVTHEIGHNMGASHHRNQNSHHGPNTALGNYTSGWRGTIEGTMRASVMTYENGSEFPDGTHALRIPYFSSPLTTVYGTVIGDVELMDNARVIRETKGVTSRYREPQQYDGNIVIDIGASNSSSSSIFVEYLVQDNITQNLYYQDELVAGSIYQMRVRRGAGQNPVPPGIIIKIYMATTTQTSFPNNTSWIPYNQFTMVYEGELDVGIIGYTQHFVDIVFDTPYLYSGGNLVVMSIKDHNESYTNSGSFYFTNTDQQRHINWRSNASGLPNVNPFPTASGVQSSILNASFYINTPFYAPRNLTADVGNNSVNLSWSPPIPSNGATLIGYRVYKNFVPIPGILSSLSFLDTNVTSGNTYHYYITAVYTNPNGESLKSNTVPATPGPQPIFNINPTSHIFDKNTSQTFTIENSGGGLLEINSIHIEGMNQSDFLFQSDNMPWVIGAGFSRNFEVYTLTNTLGTKTADLIISHNVSDTLFVVPLSIDRNWLLYEGFEGSTFPPTEWTIIGNTVGNWARTTAEGRANTGVGAANSFSWSTNPLTPNNWLITPQVYIPTDMEAELSFYRRSSDLAGRRAEQYTVYISTSGNSIGNFTTVLLNETINNTNYLYENRIIDLSSYAGQSVYIAFRHHDCYDQWFLAIDDVQITATLSDTEFNPPQNLTATAGSSIVNLSWQAPATGSSGTLSGYRVYRNGNPISGTISGLTYQDTGLTNGVTYSYYVRAIYTNPDGESEPSNTITATPQAPPPIFTIEPLTHNFGNIIVGLSSDEQTFTIANTGGSPLTINSVNLTGTHQNDFELSFATNPPWIINASGTRDFSVSFSPISVGVRSASIQIIDNLGRAVEIPLNRASNEDIVDSGISSGNLRLPQNQRSLTNDELVESDRATHNVAVSGVGVSPTFNPPQNLSASPGNTIVNLSWQVPAAGNTGTISGYRVYRNNVAITGTISSLTYLDTSLINGTTYTYNVRAIYTNPSGESALSNPAAATPQAGPNTDISPLSHNFGDIIVGQTSSSQTFTITNTGDSPLVIESITINEEVSRLLREEFQGSNLAMTGERDFLNQNEFNLDFDIAPPWNIPAGSNRTFTVSFSPLTEGAKLAEIQIIDNLGRAWGMENGEWRMENEILHFVQNDWVGDRNDRNSEHDDRSESRNSRDIHTVALSGNGISPTFNPPQNLTAAAGNQEISLSWQAPLPGSSGILSSYIIERRIGVSGSWTEIHQTTNNTTLSWTNTGLINGTTYYYQVIAVYIYPNGESIPSNEANGTPFETILPPHIAINPIPSNNATMIPLSQVLSWSPNTSGGVPTGYKIHFGTTNPPDLLESNWSTTTYLPTGMSALQNGTTYYWQIVPFNTAGDATGCPVWSFTTVDTVFNPPQNLTATAGHQEISLSWQAPLPGSTGTLSSYKIERKIGVSGSWSLVHQTTNNSTLSWINTGLINGYTYYYRVIAVYINPNGESIPSNEVYGTPFETVLPPHIAINPIPVNNATNISLTQVLSWLPNTSGGVPTGYKIHFGTTNPPSLIENNWTTTTYLPTGMSALQNGTTYYWQIVPFNTAGDATGCPVWSFTTEDTVFNPPRNLTANEGNSAVNLSWDAPLAGSSGTLTGYRVFRDNVFINQTTNLSYTDNNVSLGNTYEYYVTALYNNGESIPSNVVTITLSLYTPGLNFTLIDNGTAYQVARGTANATHIEIPAEYNGLPVTRIADWGFSGFTTMTSINIPNSMTSIGDFAFQYCTGLTSVTIGSGLTSFGWAVFINCPVTFFSVDSNVAVGLFSGFSTLATVHIGNSVTSIGENAFRNCTGLTSVTIGSGVTSIGERAFQDCTSLTSIDIPNNVTSIGERVFQDCTSLTSVTIGSGLTSFGWAVFLNCPVTSFSVDSNAAVGLFQNSSTLATVYIGNNVTSIGGGAFAGCTGLTSIDIPNSVTSIGGSAFQNCTSLTSISIPNSVTSIGTGAFLNCTGLTSVTIGNGVTSVGSSVFSILIYDLTPESQSPLRLFSI